MEWPLPLWQVLGEELDQLRPAEANVTVAQKSANNEPLTDAATYEYRPQDLLDEELLRRQLNRRRPDLKDCATQARCPTDGWPRRSSWSCPSAESTGGGCDSRTPDGRVSDQAAAGRANGTEITGETRGRNHCPASACDRTEPQGAVAGAAQEQRSSDLGMALPTSSPRFSMRSL